MSTANETSDEIGVPSDIASLPFLNDFDAPLNEDGLFDLGFSLLPEFLNSDDHVVFGQGPDDHTPMEVPGGSSFDGPVAAPTPALNQHSEPANSKFPSKIGARFSIETVSILRKWFTANKEHPYPTEVDKEFLQTQTGLSRTQIVNWISNARRRTLLQPGPRSSWWHEDISAAPTPPISIPQRPGTPAFGSSSRNLNPLERWVDSPPETEPAAVDDIARAISAGSLLTKSSSTERRDASSQRMARRRLRALASDHRTGIDNPRRTSSSDYGSDRSQNDLFASRSRNTSRSSGSSISSAYSHSHGSSGSCRTPNSLTRSHSLRRKRAARRRITGKTSLAVSDYRYQCTFCTETFKTKHDWKRHEKSLHVPLEQWFCSPDGPRLEDKENGQTLCAFCGEVEPTELHIESHNPSYCQERAFSRKDHLKQHLRLVHNATLKDSLTKHWKAPVPQIRSRCGFCGLSLDSWDVRAAHLGDHFKLGKTMADWEGDWGFDSEVQKLIENSIEPCKSKLSVNIDTLVILTCVIVLIDLERHTPAPFRAGVNPTEGPRHAYELIHSELSWFLQTNDYDLTGVPDSDVMQLEACRVIVAAETMMSSESHAQKVASSWLRDLLARNEEIMQQAKFGRIRGKGESALSAPRLDCKESLFEGCPLESQLQDYVQYQWTTNQKVVSDVELQEAACEIISHIGRESAFIQNNMVTNWLRALVHSSTDWLVEFRKRAIELAQDFSAISLVSENHSQLQEKSVRNGGNIFSAQRFIDGNLTPADHISSPASPSWDPMTYSEQPTRPEDAAQELDHRPPWVKTSLAYFNDSNFYKWLARELGRWVVATMSPNNPNCHTPSDEELRHQARCILYNE